MKSLLLTLLCSLSLASISAMDKTPLEKIQNELLLLTFATCGNRITIADIKEGKESRVSLEEALIAKFKLIDRLKRAQTILKWVELDKPTSKTFDKVFARYKKENSKQVETGSSKRSRSAITTDKEKVVPAERSFSAPAASSDEISHLLTSSKEEEESGTLSMLFKTQMSID